VTNRRPYLTGPGDSLILPPSSFALNTLYESWVADTGIEPDRLVFSALVGSPLPLRDFGRGPRGWDPQMNPAMFWHPLLWLPEAIALPLPPLDDNDVEEPLDAWALRVAWELVWSAMYDAEAGTWVDILSVYGLNVEDPAVQARVTAWLSGNQDPVLDNIDLSNYVTTDQESTLAVVAEQIDSFRTAAWGVHADELLAGLGYTLQAVTNEQDFRWTVAQFAYVALLALGDAPPLNEGGQPFSGPWQTILDEAENAAVPFATVQSRVPYLQQSLQSLSQVFYREYEQLMTLIAQDGAPERAQLPTP